MLTVEDLVRANKLLEQDFHALFKQVNTFRDHRSTIEQRIHSHLLDLETKATSNQKSPTNDILDYIAQLLDECHYGPALKVWRETSFEQLPRKPTEYYRLGILIIDQMLNSAG